MEDGKQCEGECRCHPQFSEAQKRSEELNRKLARVPERPKKGSVLARKIAAVRNTFSAFKRARKFKKEAKRRAAEKK